MIEFPKVCRLCIQNNNLNSTLINLDINLTILEKIKCLINNTLSISTNVQLPNNICNTCLEKLNQSYEFQKQILQSYEIINNLLHYIEINKEKRISSSRDLNNLIKNFPITEDTKQFLIKNITPNTDPVEPIIKTEIDIEYIDIKTEPIDYEEVAVSNPSAKKSNENLKGDANRSKTDPNEYTYQLPSDEKNCITYVCNENDKFYFCKSCNIQFTDFSTLQTHFIQHSNGNTHQINTEYSGVAAKTTVTDQHVGKCSECEETFENKEQLQMHTCSHENRFDYGIIDLNDSDSEQESMDTSTEMAQTTTLPIDNSLQMKSKVQYERQYTLFMDWRQENRTDSFSENVLLVYFQDLSTKMKPSSLWAIYSMLRMTINLKNNIDISKYAKLITFLKRTANGYKPKKSKTLTPEQIQQFLSSAPDENYLFTKVGLIFGMMGACRREELMRIETSHVEDLQTALLVHIPDPKTKTERQFVIGGSLYKICKKYMELRPSNLENVTRFFLNYQRGKCTKQPIGINKFGNLARQVATFLKLTDPNSYTGHCFRRSSATILVDSGSETTVLKHHRGLRATSSTETTTVIKQEKLT